MTKVLGNKVSVFFARIVLKIVCVRTLGFETRIRLKLDEMLAIDCNAIDDATKAAIVSNIDRKCDNCDTELQSLNDAHSHYFSAHDMSKGYFKCCDLKLRDEQVLREHIAYHLDPEKYQ